MNEENNFSPSMPEEIDYVPPTQKTGGIQNVSAPVLDDIDYAAPVTPKRDGPTGVTAPVLDDMDTYTPPTAAKKGAPTGVTAPVLDDGGYSTPAPQKLVLSDDDIIAGLTPELKEKFDALPADKQHQIIEMRRQQLGAEAPAPAVTAPILDDDNYTPPPRQDYSSQPQVTAPVLDEDNYTPPPKQDKPAEPEAPITAPILDDEPEAPVYKPKFVDEDLERAKQEAAKKAVAGQLVSEQKDSKESLRMMLELKEELRQQEAAKGFKLTIVIAIIGAVAAVAFYLLYSGQLGLTYKDGMSGASKIISNSAMYIAIAAGICSFSLLSGMGGFKSLTSFVFMLFGIIQLFPGVVMIPQHNGSMGLVVALYIVALGGTIAVFGMLSGSEAVGQFFKKPE